MKKYIDVDKLSGCPEEECGIRERRETTVTISHPASGIASELVIGEKYTINASVVGTLDSVGSKKQGIRMKCVGLYPHLAEFERPAGYRESFTYWELERVMAHE